MTIDDKAIDAAWEQARADADGYPYPEREEIRRILEAAAPYMLAEAWDAAISEASEGRYMMSGLDAEELKEDNPYRSHADQM